MRPFWIVFIVGCGFQSPAGVTDGMPPDTDVASPGGGSLQCPSTYNALGLTGPSLYRLIKIGHPAWEQSDDCNDDQPGSTHLVVIGSPQELADIKKFVVNPALGLIGGRLWIGGVQPKNATSPGDGWLGFDGAPLIDGWLNGEPKDGGGGENNHLEQFVVMEQGAPDF